MRRSEGRTAAALRGAAIATVAAVVGVASDPGAAGAELWWSGSLDVAYQHDIGKGRDEPNTRINRSLKGLSPFNLIRVRMFADAEVADDIAVFTTTLYDEGIGHFEMEGAYVVVSALGGREGLNLQVGKMATVFGRFASRSFATVNPLIGTPLIYQYFSSVHGDRVPEDAQQQLRWKDTAVAAYQTRGLPTIYDACWNTGVQLFGATRHLAWAVAVTKGALSNPAATSNDGAQLLARVGVQPTMGLQLGASAAWGPYLTQSAALGSAFPVVASVEDFAQWVVGVDGAYSFWRCEIVGELIHNRWEVPNLAAGDDALSNTGGYLEAALAVHPGWNLAARWGQIVYGEIDDGTGRTEAWDYDVRRLETGVEYYVTRDVRLKAAAQLNTRDKAAAIDTEHLLGVQLASRF